jgi:hypothetical protein
MKKTIILCLLVTAIYIPLACLDYHELPFSDGAEHGAALRELIRDIKSPGEAMLNEYHGKSPRYVPSLVLMAATALVNGLDTLTTLKLFSILFFIFFLIAVYFFTHEYFQDPQQPFWSLACILFLWGTGWDGANAYMFSALVHTACYPSVVAFACVLISLAYACRFLRNGGAGAFSGWCLFGAAAFVNHPLTAAFLWIASALLIIETGGLRGLFRPWLTAFIVISIAAMAMWPYYDFLANMLTVSGDSIAASWDYRRTRTYLYSDIAIRTGPALLAIPLLFFYTLKKKYVAITMLCLVSLCIYVAGYFLHINLAERFIFVIVFSAQILVSRCICMLWQAIHRDTASAAQTGCTTLIAALLASGVIIQTGITFREYIRPNLITSSSPPYIRYRDPTALYKNFARYIHPHDIVFTDIGTAWGIPLYTGAKILSLFHTPPHVHDNDIRIQTIDRFFDPATDNLTRQRILKDFKATKLILNSLVIDNTLKDQISAMGLPLIMQDDAVCIFDWIKDTYSIYVFDIPADVDSPAPTGPRHD